MLPGFEFETKPKLAISFIYLVSGETKPPKDAEDKRIK